MATPRSTVERLDKPSTYFSNKVCALAGCRKRESTANIHLQNKRRKSYHDRGEREEDKPQADFDASLKEATTLYVGNLYVCDQMVAIEYGLTAFG